MFWLDEMWSEDDTSSDESIFHPGDGDPWHDYVSEEEDDEYRLMAEMDNALVSNDHQEVERLLDLHPELLDAPAGTRILEEATRYDRPAVVRLLIEKGVNINAARSGETALYIAVVRRREEIIHLLLDSGADASIKSPNGESILLLSCRAFMSQHEQALRVAERLLKHTSPTLDVNEQERAEEKTCLHWAVTAQHAELVSLLLQHGADPTIVDSQGLTPHSLSIALCRSGARDSDKIVALFNEAERSRLLQKVYHVHDAEVCRQVLAHGGHKTSPTYQLPAYVASRLERGGEASLPRVVVKEAGPWGQQEGRVTRARKRKQAAARAKEQQTAVFQHVITRLGTDVFGDLMALLGPLRA